MRGTAYTNGGWTSYVEKKSYLNVSALSYLAGIDSFLNCNPISFHFKAIKQFNSPISLDTNVTVTWFTNSPSTVFSDSNANESNITFAGKGCYTVGFRATNADGCSIVLDSILNECFGQSISISSDSSVCLGDTLSLVNNSNKISSGKWKIYGDPTKYKIFPSDTSFQPKVTFSDTGYFKIVYQGLSPRGCADSSVIRVKSELMHADFYSVDTVTYCGPEIVEFNYTGTIAKNYIWDFGDGSPKYSTSQTKISHLYDIKEGRNEFTVSVRAVSNSGCYDYIEKNSYVRLIGPIPFFTIKKSKGCDPLTIEFENKSRGAATVYFYDDNGNIDSSNAPSIFITYHSKNDSDSISFYQPFMIGIDSSSTCLKAYTTKDTIIVLRKPKSNFTFDDTAVCRNQDVHFMDLSSHHVTRYWDFDGDGVIDDSVPNPTFAYKKAGYYYPKIITYNETKCVDTFTSKIAVAVFPIVAPTIKFSSKIVCLGEQVSIDVAFDSS
ncbi:MAG: hypothetical protein HYZ42_03400, partial [Bacteroidetes bacterium]|nr:hypothetical protein [Bacteroidota bacterium]